MTIRWGLCCQFLDAPIRFRSATHRHVATLDPRTRHAYLAAIARDNASALRAAVEQCASLGIGAFRISSGILPLATHPASGYALADLDADGSITAALRSAGELARSRDIRLSFHPDQFVVLNSVREEVVASSIAELELQGSLAELVGADTLTVHAGGATGGKAAALDRLSYGLARLTTRARQRLALENDDRIFTVADLLPLCERERVPLVYDVHHHRCNPDGLDTAGAATQAAATWGAREPWFHVSSARDPGGDPRPHADFVRVDDVPAAWVRLGVTVDVEAKAKERAVLALRDAVVARAASRAIRRAG